MPVEQVKETVKDNRRYLLLSKPALPMQHHRFAGSDYQEGDMVVDIGVVIRPSHIMAMASLGISEVVVKKPLRIAVISTGSELISHESNGLAGSQIFDSNGPYLAAAL